MNFSDKLFFNSLLFMFQMLELTEQFISENWRHLPSKYFHKICINFVGFLMKKMFHSIFTQSIEWIYYFGKNSTVDVSLDHKLEIYLNFIGKCPLLLEFCVEKCEPTKDEYYSESFSWISMLNFRKLTLVYQQFVLHDSIYYLFLENAKIHWWVVISLLGESLFAHKVSK